MSEVINIIFMGVGSLVTLIGFIFTLVWMVGKFCSWVTSFNNGDKSVEEFYEELENIKTRMRERESSRQILHNMDYEQTRVNMVFEKLFPNEEICPACNSKGSHTLNDKTHDGYWIGPHTFTCDTCNGIGRVSTKGKSDE